LYPAICVYASSSFLLLPPPPSSSSSSSSSCSYQVLLAKKYLDQGQISELAMMSPRETRERLYQMYRDQLVTFQEVPKRADHNPGNTYYLWTIKVDQVRGREGREVVAACDDKAWSTSSGGGDRAMESRCQPTYEQVIVM